MKMRLLTALIAAACFSQAASALDLTTGSISSMTTATADVVISQPVTLENTLTPVAGLRAGATSRGTEYGATIATGKLAIKETGVTAHLALKILDSDENPLHAYAEGHQGEDAYRLRYAVTPDFRESNENNWAAFKTSEGEYGINMEELSQVHYKVIEYSDEGVLPKAGKYTISVTGAVYNP